MSMYLPPVIPGSSASSVITPAAPYIPPAAPPAAPVEQAAPTVVQRVTLTPLPSRSDLLKAGEQWSWAEFRDYVCAEIICRFGAFPRDSRKEYGIFSRYLSTFGNTDAIRIAEYAFGPVCEGWWGNAPISVNRFCRASDPYFSIPILERLNEVSSS